MGDLTTEVLLYLNTDEVSDNVGMGRVVGPVTSEIVDTSLSHVCLCPSPSTGHV